MLREKYGKLDPVVEPDNDDISRNDLDKLLFGHFANQARIIIRRRCVYNIWPFIVRHFKQSIFSLV